MSDHPFDSSFSITREQSECFQRDGFVKLEGFLNAGVIDTLRDRVEVEMSRKRDNWLTADARFTRAQYDFASNKNDIFELLERPYFRRALTDLAERELFLTFELCFELEKNVSKGFPWHVGIQSFGYQFAEEFGCTLWAPLHPVDRQGQRGGMAYVSERVLSGDFLFRYIESAVISTIEAKERAGVRTSVGEYFDMRSEILNSPPIVDILEWHEIEDDFAPGDALLFKKQVVHRSVGLGDGTLPRRAAYVMRFVDAASHYDLQRARNLEFPVEKYGEGFLPYRPLTRQHIEIAEAGAQDGAVLADCAYFEDRERRLVRRTFR